MRRRFMNKVDEVEELPYLTIEALQDGLTAKLSINACQYSTDGVTWIDLAANTATSSINAGEKLYFKATLIPSSSGIGTFTVSKNFKLSGNCMSMLFGDEAASSFDLTGYNYAFYKLFYNCKTLQTTSSDFLPATTLASSCYRNMFYNCTGLTIAPELPATTLANHCYYGMFYYCTRLTIAPELPATTLASGCYRNMFYNCTGLTIAPELPATTLTDSCYSYMFSYCTGLTIAPELPATTLANHCYDAMFENCTGLTIAPELPATTLVYRCYYSMFKDCTGLTIAPKLPATTLTDSCYSYMFYKCTGLTVAPELPATTLTDNCYNSMFWGCSKINYIKAMFTTTPSYYFTSIWVYGVASSGTFVKNSAATWDVTGASGVPSGWTVETASA